MKAILSFICALFISAIAHADCTDAGLYFWPQGNYVQQNAIFTIEGYADSRRLIEQLSEGRHEIYLISENHKVKLLVSEPLKGAMGVKMAILTPSEELHSGAVYELSIPNRELYYYGEELEREHPETGEKGPITWTVIQGTDTIAPAFVSAPTLKGSSYNMYGCGSSSFLKVKFDINDTSEVMVKTTLTDLKTGSNRTYIVLYRRGGVYLGHGMCSGEFSVRQDGKYAATFVLIDACGNASEERSSYLSASSE
jgi:hypothetical protein